VNSTAFTSRYSSYASANTSSIENITRSYRYGFNGMESDDEVKGVKNSYTTEFRQYDPRIGRFLSLDPMMLKYPSTSPYIAFRNNPIFFIDPFGDDPPPYYETNQKKAKILDPFEVRAQIEQDRAEIRNGTKKEFTYLENLWYSLGAGSQLTVVTKGAVYKRNRKGKEEYYGLYFVPQIVTDVDGNEIAHLTQGSYVLTKLEGVRQNDFARIRPKQRKSDDAGREDGFVSVGDLILGHSGVEQMEAAISFINEHYAQTKKDIIEQNEYIDKNSFEITSINITINQDAPDHYKTHMRTLLENQFGDKKLTIEEGPLRNDAVYDAEVNFDYTEYK
jgi:RHS repeat-associated protein